MRMVMLKNVRTGEAPEASAASSMEESMEENAAEPMRNATGTTCIDCTRTMPARE